MFVDIDDERIGSLVNTVAHEGMHLNGAGEANATVTGYMADLAYRANALANREAIDSQRPAPVAIQNPGAHQELLGGNQAVFAELGQRDDLEFRQFTDTESNLLDHARFEIQQNSELSEVQRQQANADLNALACAEVRCANGVSRNDPHYDLLQEVQARGEALQAEGEDVESTLSTYGVQGEGVDDSFDYGWRDRSDDVLSRHENVVAGTHQLGGTAAGVGEAIGGAVLAPAGCVVTAGLACAGSAAAGGYLMYDGVTRSYDNAVALTSEHQYQSGANVINSFSAESHPGAVSPALDAAYGLGIVAAEATIAGGTVRVLRRVDDLLDAL